MQNNHLTGFKIKKQLEGKKEEGKVVPRRYMLLSLMMIGATWCLLTFIVKVNPIFLPSPLDVVEAFHTLYTDGYWYLYLTVFTGFIGFFCRPSGYSLGRSNGQQQKSRGLFVAFHWLCPLPSSYRFNPPYDFIFWNRGIREDDSYICGYFFSTGFNGTGYRLLGAGRFTQSLLHPGHQRFSRLYPGPFTSCYARNYGQFENLYGLGLDLPGNSRIGGQQLRIRIYS